MKKLLPFLLLIIISQFLILNCEAQTWGSPVAIPCVGSVGEYSQLLVVNGNPAMAYYDATHGDLLFSRSTDATGTAWSNPVILDNIDDVGKDISIQIVNGNPAISYLDETSDNLKYVRANNASGTSWGTPIIVDGGIGAGFSGSLQIVNGNPAISYHDAANGDLKYVRASDVNGTIWGTPVTVDGTGFIGQYTSLQIANGNPAISYYDLANGDLKYIRALESNGIAWGTPQTLESTGDVGQYTSLQIVNGNPAISYYDNTNADLKYIRATNADGTAWGTPQTLSSALSVGKFTSLQIINGKPAISFYDNTFDNLKYIPASDADGSAWYNSVTVDAIGTTGQYTSMVSTGNELGIAYYSATDELPYFVWGTCNSSTAPTLSATFNPLCDGSSSTLSIASGSLNDALDWQWYSTSCGGTALGSGTSISVSPTATTTYFARGEGECPSPGACGSITVTVNPILVPSATIAITTGTNPICAGSSVTFTATIANYGSIGSIIWRKNGVFVQANSLIYTDAGLLNGDVITFQLNSAAPCALPPSITSNSITMTVNPILTPSVSIAITTGTNPTCSGSTVTFTATPTYGAATPVYQWKKDGSNVGTNSPSYTDNGLVSGTIICVMTSNVACPSTNPVTSNTIALAVNPILVPSATIAITSGSNPTCEGSSITFTATPTNGGTAPTYNFKVNGISVQNSASVVFTTTLLNNNDVVTCTMTSNAVCPSPNPVTSNSITMTVIVYVSPALTISASPNTGNPPGTLVTFTATPVNGGPGPVYVWKKNNIVVGNSIDTYTDNTLIDGDFISCTLTSDFQCLNTPTANSNVITMTVGNLGDYRTRATGNWTATTVWQRFNGTSWVNVTTAPTSTDENITIRGGHIITVTTSRTVDQVAVNSGGRITHTGGTLTVNDGTGIDLACSGTYSLAGGALAGTGLVEFNSGSTFTWSAGSMIGTGTTQINEGCTFTTTNTAEVYFTTGRTLNIGDNAIWTWSGSSPIRMDGIPQQTINNSGTWIISGNAAINPFASALPVINNLAGGIIRKTSGGVTGIASPITVINDGSIEVNAGTLQVEKLTSQNGAVSIASGATLRLYGSSTNNTDLATYTGSGTLKIDNAFQINSPVNLAFNSLTTNLTSGGITGTGIITFNSGSAFNWSAGNITGTGTTQINQGCTFTTTNGADIDLATGRTLNIGVNATWTWSGAGNIRMNALPQQTINNSGTWIISGTGDIVPFGNPPAPTPVINNLAGGIIRKTSGGVTGIASPITVINDGSIEVNAGTLQIEKLTSQNGAVSIASGATLRLYGSTTNNTDLATYTGSGTLNIDNAFQVNSPVNLTFNSLTTNLISGGITGTGIITFNSGSAFNWSAGNITGTGTTQINQGCTFTTTNGADIDLATGRTLNIGVNATWTWSGAGNIRMNALPQQTINNSGTWIISGTGDIVPFGNPAPTPVINNLTGGIIRKTSGGPTGIVSPITVNNAGSIEVNAGTLTINNFGTTQSGTYTVASGAILAGATLNYTGSNFTNNGSVTLTSLNFTGTAAQQLNGTGTTITKLVINGSGGTTLGGTQTIGTNFTLTSGKITLGNNDLLMATAATLTGGSASSYCITDGTGSLRRRVVNNNTDVLFPIGLATDYLPAKIKFTAGSTADDLKVKVISNFFESYDGADNPLGVSIPTRGVNLSWIVKETVLGGSNATITLQWNQNNESMGFNRANSRFGHYTGGTWSLATSAPATGSNPYTLSQSGITTFSPFDAIEQFVTCTQALGPLCTGGAVSIPYNVVGSFFAGNVFTAQLSDASGSFAAPTTIGTITTDVAGTINAVIPPLTADGMGYRVRIISNNPVSTGPDNGSDITIAACTSTWVGTSNSNWNDGTNWSPTGVPNSCNTNVVITASGNNPVIAADVSVGNITLNAGAAMTLNAVLSVCGSITANTNNLTGTGTLNLGGSGNQTLTGTLNASCVVNISTGATLVTTGGTLLLQNGGYLMHGTGTPGAGGAVTGNITMTRQGTTLGTKYNYWSTPVASGNLLGSNQYNYNPAAGTHTFTDDNPGPDPGWAAFSGTMTTAKGYASAGGGLGSFAGTANDGNINIAVATSGLPLNSTVAPSKFNLIGNPYPSPISASLFRTGNAGVLAGSIYYWDDDNSGGSGYASNDYAVSTGVGSTAGGGGNTPNGLISSCQGVFVEAVANGSAQFTNSMRGGLNNQFFKTDDEEYMNRIWLSLNNESLYNEILIAFKDDATEDRDVMYDAYKRRGSGVIAFTAIQQEDEFAIVAFPPVTAERIVPLGVSVANAGSYTITNKLAEYMESIPVWLEDRLLGSFTDISNNGNYISYMDAVNTEDRYFLHFAPSITSITEQGNPAGIKTYTSGNELYVLFTNIPETSGTLKLVDLLGQEIVIKNNVSTKNNVCILNLPTLSAGVYTISFITEAKVYSSKLFIR